MSKPIELYHDSRVWVRKSEYDDMVEANDILRAAVLAVHSRADKLAEALDVYADPQLYKPQYSDDPHVNACEDWAIEALKEYRGNDE